jgi:hypothetical protein
MQPFMGYLSGNDTAGNSRMIRTSGIKIVLEIMNRREAKVLRKNRRGKEMGVSTFAEYYVVNCRDI